MASDADISSIPPHVCVFWKAPVEVRDMFYDLVYGGPRQFKFQCRLRWKELQKVRERLQREEFIPTEFPAGPLAHLIVSKQYFEEATQLWMRGTTFVSGWPSDYFQAWRLSTTVNKFILEQISSVALSDAPSFLRESMPHLLDLTIRISDDEYVIGENKHKKAWLDEYTDLELATIGKIEQVLQFRGLRSFNLVQESCWRAKTPEQKKRWEALQKQTEKLIRDVTTQPPEPRSESCEPLDFKEALRITMEAKASAASEAAGKAREGSIVPAPLHDQDVPQSEDALLRLLLTRPKALIKWIEDVKARPAAQSRTFVQQRDEPTLSGVLSKPQLRHSSRLRAPKTKTDTQQNVPSSRMPSSPDWHFTKDVDSETLEEVVRCTENTKPMRRRAR